MTTLPRNDLSPHKIIALATAFWSSKVLLSALELGVFRALAERPRTGEELRADLSIEGRGTADLFDSLVSLELLDRSDSGVYRNAPHADAYLNPLRPEGDISGYLAFLNPGFAEWSRLTEDVLSGDRLDFTDALSSSGGVNGGGGAPVAADTQSDGFGAAFPTPDQIAGFVRAITGYSPAAYKALATRFDWTPVGAVVDVGSSEGALLAHLLGAHPHLHGIGFDLPAVRDRFTGYLDDSGVADRARFVAGDLLTDPLPSGDVLVLGPVLRDGNPDIERLLIRKAYDALGPGGSLLIHGSLFDGDRHVTATGPPAGLDDSSGAADGLGRTGAECRERMAEAGFRNITSHHLDGPEHMVVGVK
ncbi:methyltransferase [Streptomyces violaceusniger]|uniref:Methyltransferase/methylase n=1 Tax=Streptomyces violaceusniger TaxID=68280 RepID=A0A4D4KVG6_STRVO|nr:methyltransferase/methylase [Streptomyces violaceusniger]